MELNVQQHTAVVVIHGPVLVIAGPGSGKTAVLIERMVYMIAQDIAPTKILAITFTNKAAHEIRERLRVRLSSADNPDLIVPLVPPHTAPHISTIHSLAWMIIQESGSQDIVNQFKRSIQNDSIEFDELLKAAVELLEDQPDILARYQQRWQYIMIDEYQDTDPLQAKLIRLLGAEHKNMCAIGDPDQAIYSFRGATMNNILQFTDQYPEAVVIRLEQNYRNSQMIARAAQAMIEHNHDRMQKHTTSMQSGGELIQVAEVSSPRQEAKHVLNTIEQLIGGSSHFQTYTQDFSRDGRDERREYHFSDIAVLYRLNVIGEKLEEQFLESGLPFQRVGEVNFFDRPEIKDLLERIRRLDLSETDRLDSADGQIGKAEHVAISLSQQLNTIIEQQSLKVRYDNGSLKGQQAYDRILELAQMAEKYDDLEPQQAREQLLERASLSRDEDYWNPEREAITLMSVHAAKGLEFPVVFVVGVEEGLFPYTQKKLAPDRLAEHLEEERRLLYVAMTRAKDVVYMSYTRQRKMYGRELHDHQLHDHALYDRKIPGAASRFITEIPSELKSETVVKAKPRKPPQLKLL